VELEAIVDLTHGGDLREERLAVGVMGCPLLRRERAEVARDRGAAGGGARMALRAAGIGGTEDAPAADAKDGGGHAGAEEDPNGSLHDTTSGEGGKRDGKGDRCFA
jgi:hypothetical protein